MPEEAIAMVAQNLSRISPHLDFIDPELDEEFCGVLDEGWEMVIVMICVSRKQTAGHLGKECPLSTSRQLWRHIPRTHSRGT